MTLALVPNAVSEPLDTERLEHAVIASLFLAPVDGLRICHAVQLNPRHFRDRRAKILFRVFEKFAEEGTLALANPLTVETLLRLHGMLDAAGGLDFLDTVRYAVPEPSAIGYYAQAIVRSHRGPREMVARSEQDAQVGRAKQFLDLGADAFLRWPLRGLDDVLGGLAPDEVHWVFAHTGSGKTSFCQTMIKHWVEAGRRVYSAGLEIAPHRLRVQTACRWVGVDHGQLFKGNLQALPEWPAVREQLKAQLDRQRDDPVFERLRLAPYELLTADVAARICEEAHDFGADVVVIDHVDHLDADGRGGSERSESMAVVKVINSLTKAFHLRTICTSQTNREGKAANKLRDHYPLTSEMGRFGDHKIQSGTTAIGLRRPIRPDFDKAAMAEARQNYAKVQEILAPHTMAANVMKDRNGNTLASDVMLGFWRGEVLSDPMLARVRAS